MMQKIKEDAVLFLRLVTKGDIEKAYSLYVASDFTHHNQYVPPDRESLKQGMIENHKDFPHKVYKVLHVLEDGDLVAVHGEVMLEVGKEIATVHILRFENGKIIEMWDVGQVKNT